MGVIKKLYAETDADDAGDYSNAAVITIPSAFSLEKIRKLKKTISASQYKEGLSRPIL